MNFSLRYITEEKKKIAKNEAVGSEANLSAR